jgi:hypothetical protein
MVRLVFRPYTQVRKAICTSAHLRASTRVSSGFALLRHSSPSFGSQQVCSYSNLSQKIMVGRWCSLRFPPLSFLAPRGFSTHQLAHMLDSLVRVSRRAGWAPSASDSSLRPRSRSLQVQGRTPPLPARVTPADRHHGRTRPVTDATARGARWRPNRFPPNNFRYFSLSFQSSFHLSFTVLVRYRSRASI